MVKKKIFLRHLLLSLFTLLLISCSGNDDKDILVRIGDRQITVSEFYNRAELTPRPYYCRTSSERDKNIVLNSLIMEKLFALEGKSYSDLMDEPLFQEFIKGRKEQYMREELFNKMTVSENKLDSLVFMNTFKLAGLVYEVEFYTMSKEKAIVLQKEMQQNPQASKKLFNQTAFSKDTPLTHTIRFEDSDFPSIQYTLYDKKWNKGDIVGPVGLSETEYMMLKIKNVLVEPAISQTEILNRRALVREKLVEKETHSNWNNFTARVMKGKKLKYNPDITTKVANLWAASFLNNDKIKQVKNFSDKDFGQFMNEIDLLSDEKMFYINDDVWTVDRFKNVLLSHPLVFRKVEIKPDEFIQQFRFAVADLVQDYFITLEAYSREIDKSQSVKNNVAMWEDAILAMEHRKKMVAKQIEKSGKNETDYHRLMDGYIENLKEKYNKKITVNMELFKKIKLTHTDFISAQQFSPYEKIVPGFPLLTKDDILNYNQF